MDSSLQSDSERLPGPQQYVKQWPFGQCSQALGCSFSYCWGLGRCSVSGPMYCAQDIRGALLKHCYDAALALAR